jgi:hypothetical protein
MPDPIVILVAMFALFALTVVAWRLLAWRPVVGYVDLFALLVGRKNRHAGLSYMLSPGAYAVTAMCRIIVLSPPTSVSASSHVTLS